MSKRETTALFDSNRSIAVVVKVALEDLAPEDRDVRSVCVAVKRRATAAEWLAWGEQTLVLGVRAALRVKKSDGTPVAMSINGVYRDPEQMSFPEFVRAAYDMSKRGIQMYDRTRELAEQCQAVTNRTFDAEALIDAVNGGASVEDVLAMFAA
jgi:hypothetical protein